jgi:DNA-binding response OmpR family regulator
MTAESKKYTIALIDDDKWLLALYGEKFRLEGFTVHTATNGKDGYALILIEKPDLIISDVVMPNGDGFELLNKVRHNSELKNIPFISLTNLSSDRDQAEMDRLGADAYLIKSDFTPSQAVGKIRVIMAKIELKRKNK